jgi:hypothetical protein
MRRYGKRVVSGLVRDHALVCVAWMALVLAGCSLSGPTRGSLSEEVEAQFQVPGSNLLASGGTDREQTPEGDIPAIAWRRYGADASWEEVVAYFEAELHDRGWESGGGSSGLRSTIEYAVEAWHKGDRILRLGHLRNSPKPDAGSFQTFYSVALIGQGVPSE